MDRQGAKYSEASRRCGKNDEGTALARNGSDAVMPLGIILCSNGQRQSCAQAAQ
jgi:hypothetical protein